LQDFVNAGQVYDHVKTENVGLRRKGSRDRPAGIISDRGLQKDCRQLIPKEQLERTALFDYVESHPTYQPAKWCTKSPCPKGVHCSFAHRKQAPAGTSQATPRRVTHINVEGVQVPIEQLQRTALFDYVQKHPEYKPAKWCTNSPCPKGVNCSFAHRGRRKPHLTSK